MYYVIQSEMWSKIDHFQVQAQVKFLCQLLKITESDEPTWLLFTIVHWLEQDQM